ncbi:hypothetical protein [Rhizobium phage RHph_X3_2]|nr:hypothetical protein [Rhizobium phage RHph_X3_2]
MLFTVVKIAWCCCLAVTLICVGLVTFGVVPCFYS